MYMYVRTTVASILMASTSTIDTCTYTCIYVLTRILPGELLHVRVVPVVRWLGIGSYHRLLLFELLYLKVSGIWTTRVPVFTERIIATMSLLG